MPFVKIVDRVLGTEKVHLADPWQARLAGTPFVEGIGNEDDPAGFALFEFVGAAANGIPGKVRIVYSGDAIGQHFEIHQGKRIEITLMEGQTDMEAIRSYLSPAFEEFRPFRDIAARLAIAEQSDGAADVGGGDRQAIRPAGATG